MAAAQIDVFSIEVESTGALVNIDEEKMGFKLNKDLISPISCVNVPDSNWSAWA